jgi:hypothetical protein
MDIHHDTSFMSILEDDSISSTFKTHICFCSGKRVGLWLIIKPSMRSFHITHSTFILLLCFHLDLIQPLASSFFTCECGHKLDAFGRHLIRCPFKGKWMPTHDNIWNIMYDFIQENGHVVWKEQWYALTLKKLLWTNLYMTWLERTKFLLSMWWLLTQFECH